LKENYESLDRGVSKWIFLRSQFLSLSEKWSVTLLSFASVNAFLIATNRSPNWCADLSAIALITTVFILVFQAFDLGANRSETEVADLLNKQMPLLRTFSALRALRTHPEARLRVRPETPARADAPSDGTYERAYLPTRQNDLRFLAQLLNAAGLSAVLLLLLDKHGLINLW
jgi:hypothetical protein